MSKRERYAVPSVTLNMIFQNLLDTGWTPYRARAVLNDFFEQYPPPGSPPWRLKFTDDMRGLIVVTPEGEMSGDYILPDLRAVKAVYGQQPSIAEPPPAKHAGGAPSPYDWALIARLDDDICDAADTCPQKKDRASRIVEALKAMPGVAVPAQRSVENRLKRRP